MKNATKLNSATVNAITSLGLDLRRPVDGETYLYAYWMENDCDNMGHDDVVEIEARLKTAIGWKSIDRKTSGANQSGVLDIARELTEKHSLEILYIEALLPQFSLEPNEKAMSSKYAGTCSRTGQRFKAGTMIAYNKKTHTARIPTKC